jgi:hypothetical protein
MRKGIVILAASVGLLLVNAATVLGATPSNNRFGRATVIQSLPYQGAVNTRQATEESAGPSCNGAGHSVWYRFTPSADINLVGRVNANFDATLSVYTGPRTNLRDVGCSDDPPIVAFAAKAGTTYHFMIASCCGSSGGAATLIVEEYDPATVDVGFRGGIVDERTGDAIIRGILTCENTSGAYVSITLRQPRSDDSIATGSAGVSIQDCDGTPQRWKVLVMSDRVFRPGWARVVLSAGTCGSYNCASEEINRVARLVPRS